ncbi:hypothetical protein SAMN05428977_10431 [Nitrosomonas sp. Nm166]|nr:hypothetical protein SAMN05428977_10431 [Nitrosomonas sp. Nm166]
MLRNSKLTDYYIKKIKTFALIPINKAALLLGRAEVDERNEGAKRHRDYHVKLKRGRKLVKYRLKASFIMMAGMNTMVW